MEHIFLLLLSVLSAYGIAVALVQKGDEWPIKWIVGPLKKLLGKINPNAPKVLDCVVCLSFWTSLLTDIILLIFTRHYFAWPLSGFVTLGFAWTIMEFFNSFDKIVASKTIEKGLDEELHIEEPLPKYERDVASIAHVVSRGDKDFSIVEGEEVKPDASLNPPAP